MKIQLKHTTDASSLKFMFPTMLYILLTLGWTLFVLASFITWSTPGWMFVRFTIVMVVFTAIYLSIFFAKPTYHN